jgi:hypothetical protein
MNPGAGMSDPGAIVMTLLLGISVIGMAIVAPFVGAFRNTRPRAGVFAASALIIMGTTGWFGSSLSAVGGLNWLPRSWEWPVGTADGVITMPDSTHVVPHVFSGRVQIYDAHWKFLRGWAIGSWGGDFRVMPSGADRFDVMKARSDWRDTYRLTGEHVARAKLERYYWTLPRYGERLCVPTSPWLLVFSGHMTTWLMYVLGLATLGFLKWRENRALNGAGEPP